MCVYKIRGRTQCNSNSTQEDNTLLWILPVVYVDEQTNQRTHSQYAHNVGKQNEVILF